MSLFKDSNYAMFRKKTQITADCVKVRTREEIITGVKEIIPYGKTIRPGIPFFQIPSKYQIRIRYAAAGDAKRTFFLNGEPIGIFEIPSSGSFGDSSTDWLTYTLERGKGQLILPLKAGKTELKIRNTDGSSLNLDYIQLIPVI